MSTRWFLVSVLIITSATAAYGYNIGSSNGAAYFFVGDPDVHNKSAGFGTSEVGGTVDQHAAANNPGGFGVVGQKATAKGGQFSGRHVQAQGMCGSLSQGAVKVGGSGYVTGSQCGTVGMNQGSCTGTTVQSSRATGMQYTGMYGGGSGLTCEKIHVSTGQAQIH